ncbi:MAG: DUF262 domain-containing protein [Colwellia sp.]|nr:DUF262 domain-containing protein [Colwellia sp.]
MKTIGELRTVLDFYPGEINSSVSFFAKEATIDFDVHLPTRGVNLQRELVWNIDQKRELIWSILMRRNIPRMAMINTFNGVYQIIDGKQRLSTMLDFYNNKFTLEIDEIQYLFKHLPKDYISQIGGYYFPYLIVNEDYDKRISDTQKINWFKFINFAGTPQERAHLETLK